MVQFLFQFFFMLRHFMLVIVPPPEYNVLQSAACSLVGLGKC